MRRDAIVGAESAAATARSEGVETVRAAFATLARRLEFTAEHPFESLDMAAVARGETPEVQADELETSFSPDHWMRYTLGVAIPERTRKRLTTET